MVENLIYGVYALLAGFVITLILALWKISDRITDKLETSTSNLTSKIDSANEKIGLLLASLEGFKEILRSSSNPDARFTLEKTHVDGHIGLHVGYSSSEITAIRIDFIRRQIPEWLPREVSNEMRDHLSRSSVITPNMVIMYINSTDPKEIAKISTQFLRKLDDKYARLIKELELRGKTIDEEFTKLNPP